MTATQPQPPAKRGRGRPAVGDTRLPALAVPATLRAALQAIADRDGITLAEAHRRTLQAALT